MKANAWELTQRTIEILQEQEKLSNQLSQETNEEKRAILERRIDILLAEFLDYKHLLEDTKVQMI